MYDFQSVCQLRARFRNDAELSLHFRHKFVAVCNSLQKALNVNAMAMVVSVATGKDGCTRAGTGGIRSVCLVACLPGFCASKINEIRHSTEYMWYIHNDREREGESVYFFFSFSTNWSKSKIKQTTCVHSTLSRFSWFHWLVDYLLLLEAFYCIFPCSSNSRLIGSEH